MGFKFLKWVEIIKAESEAVKRNAMYVLQKDAETCDVIFIDSKGGKRKASGLTLPQIEKHLARIDATNIDTIAQEQWRSVLNLYTKSEVDDISEALSKSISDESTSRQSADTNLQQNIGTEAQARIAADTNLQQNIDTEAQARIAADTSLQQNIDAEAQARIAGDADLAQNHSELQVVVNALKTWKDAMTNEDEDNLVNTLNEMLAVMASVPEGTNIYAVLASKVNTSDIVNNLTSSLTNAPLSAYQGSVLKGLIDGLQTAINNEAKSRSDADNLKLDKPTTTITAPNSTYKWVSLLNDTGDTVKMLAGDLGKNIANSSLTSISGAGMTQGASYTWNAANYPFNITGLPDKSTDSTFKLMLTTNTEGQIAKSNGVQLMLGGMGAMTDAQKDAWRTANLKTGETWSKAQAVISSVNPPTILQNPNYTQYVSLIGSNLFIDNTGTSAQVKIIDSLGNETLISNFTVMQSNPNVLTFPITSGQLATGDYTFKVFNAGVWSAVNAQAKLRVRNALNNLTIPTLTWAALDNAGNVPANYTGSQTEGNVYKDFSDYLNPKLYNYSQATKRAYAQTNENIITPTMMQNGVILEINATFNGFGGTNHIGEAIIGIISSPNLNNDNSLFAGAKFFGITLQNLTYLPSNTNNSISGSYSGTTEKIFFIIESGILTIVFVNKAKVFSLPIDTSVNYKLKFINISQSMSTIMAELSLSIKNIYSLQ